uniref:Uncharacterized protein n=1 Tax=Anguilla anguilla TaxID=7936 RepID=A0A0E9VXL1_ANGAN
MCLQSSTNQQLTLLSSDRPSLLSQTCSR